jgi:hypothetical protein
MPVCLFFDCNICWPNFYLIGSCAQIYSAVVSVFLGGNKPSRTGNARGDISINFSCDPAISSKLVGFYYHNLFLFFFVLIIGQSAHYLGLAIFLNRLILLWMRYYVFKRKVLQMKMFLPSLKLSKEPMKMDFR